MNAYKPLNSRKYTAAWEVIYIYQSLLNTVLSPGLKSVCIVSTAELEVSYDGGLFCLN